MPVHLIKSKHAHLLFLFRFLVTFWIDAQGRKFRNKSSSFARILTNFFTGILI